MADVTYYVALPFLQDETGSPVAGAAEECQSSAAALRRAEVLSRAPGSIGAVAFSRTGDPTLPQSFKCSGDEKGDFNEKPAPIYGP